MKPKSQRAERRENPKLTLPTRSPEQLGRAIERFRAASGHTQMTLARAAGMRQATLSKTERGADSTAIKTIYAICAALNLELVLRPRVGGRDEFRPEDVF